MSLYIQNRPLSEKPTLLLAGSCGQFAPYVRFFEGISMQVTCIPMAKNGQLPPLHSLSKIPYDILLLPGGGDFSPYLYTTDADFSQPLFQMSPAEILQSSSLDTLQFCLLTRALQQKKPVIGICKGMQLLNVYFGGTLYEDLSSSLHPHQETDSIHTIFTISPNQFYPKIPYSKSFLYQAQIYKALMPVVKVNSAHHQGIRHLADDFICLQYAPDKIVETILHKTLPVIGFQWHPERCSTVSPSVMSTIIHHLLQISSPSA